MFTNKTTRYLSVSLVLVLLAVAATVYLWFDIKDRGQTLMANAASVQNQAFLSQELVRLEELLEETSNERLGLSELVLANESEAVDFLSVVDDTASQLGLELATENLQVVETPETGFDLLSVEFTITGGETAAFTMLRYLESIPYSSQLVSLSVERFATNETVVLNTEVQVSIQEND